MIKQYFIIAIIGVLAIGFIPSSYAQITFTNVDIICDTGGQLDFTGVLTTLRICPPVPALTNTAPTFSQITHNSALMSWTATDTSENLYGYNIQLSTDDVSFVQVVSNTANTQTTYQLNGLNENQIHYLQWRNVFFDGSFGDWSTSGSFTTGQGGGGGVTDPIIEDIIDELTQCPFPQILNDITQTCELPILPEEFDGLTAIDLLRSNVETIAPGETKRAILEIIWVGDTPLTVESLDADKSTGLKFAFTENLTFNPTGSDTQISRIPYTLEAPELICVDEQTPKCVFNDAKYVIPVKVVAVSNNDIIKFEPELTIYVQDDHVFGAEEIGLIVLGIVIAVFSIGKATKKKKRPKKF